MKKRLLAIVAIILATLMCMTALASCGPKDSAYENTYQPPDNSPINTPDDEPDVAGWASSQTDWGGTYVQDLGDGYYTILEISDDDGSGWLDVKLTDLWISEDGGVSSSAITVFVEITDDNIAENADFCLTFEDDTLIFDLYSSDFDDKFQGEYHRGEMPGVVYPSGYADAEVPDLLFGETFYPYGDEEDGEYIVFFEYGEADWSTYRYVWEYSEPYITLYDKDLDSPVMVGVSFEIIRPDYILDVIGREFYPAG